LDRTGVNRRAGMVSGCTVPVPRAFTWPAFLPSIPAQRKLKIMNIGLYFGSFNPVHVGHLIIANHILEQTALDKIWFVVSPQNPLKPSHTLLNEFDRFHLVELAIADNPGFRASNVEFHLPKPSYTVNTLAYLSEKFPLEQFTVIIGSDSYQNISCWKNAEILLENYPVIVYQRPGFPVADTQFTHQ